MKLGLENQLSKSSAYDPDEIKTSIQLVNTTIIYDKINTCKLVKSTFATFSQITYD